MRASYPTNKTNRTFTYSQRLYVPVLTQEDFINWDTLSLG